MFKAIKEFFLGKPAEATQPEAAPYKVETAPAVQVAVEGAGVVEAKPAPAKKAAPKAKAPAKPKAPVKKATAPKAKAPAKAPAKKAPAKAPAKKAPAKKAQKSWLAVAQPEFSIPQRIPVFFIIIFQTLNNFAPVMLAIT